jgi:hypothetical protein
MNNFDEAVSGEVIENVISTEIVEFKESTVIQAFTAEDGLKSVVNDAKELVANYKHDLSTKKGRDRTKSFSAKFPKLKTTLDGLGFDLVAGMKKQCKVIDVSRKAMRDELDALRIIARQPLTDWEAEDARLKAEEAARLESEKLLAQFNNDHEMGLLLDDKHDRDIAEAKAEQDRLAKEAEAKAAQEAKDLEAKQEAERIERDARIAQEAADKAIADAKYKAKLEAELVRVDKFNSDHEIALLTNNKLIADAEKIASDERAKVQAEEAEKRRVEAVAKAKSDAKEAAEQARLNEVKRQEVEAAKVKADLEKREANKRNVSKKLRAIKESLMEYVDEPTAKLITLALHEKKIPHTEIKY